MPEIWCHWTNNNKKTPTKCVFECTYINVYLICIPHVCMYTSPSYGKSQSLSLMTFCTTWRDSMVTYGNINKLLITISSKCIMLINPHDPWALVTVFVVLQVLQVSIPALKKKKKHVPEVKKLWCSSMDPITVMISVSACDWGALSILLLLHAGFIAVICTLILPLFLPPLSWWSTF